MSFVLFTSIPPDSDFMGPLSSWRKAGFEVFSVNNPHEAPSIRAAGVNVVEVDDENHKPRISHIMQAIIESDAEAAGIINSDCAIISTVTAEAISRNIQNTILLAERIDVNQELQPIEDFPYGFDAFFFHPSIIKRIVLDDRYRIGIPWWDYWFPLACREAGISVKRFVCPILFHKNHEKNWSVESHTEFGEIFRSGFSSAKTISLPPEDNTQMAHYCYRLLMSSPKISLDCIPREIEMFIASIPERISQLMAEKRIDGQTRHSPSADWPFVKRLIWACNMLNFALRLKRKFASR